MHGDWLQALLAGIALAIAMLPEEFTVVLTVLPALGAWRLSRQQVLTRRIAAIETLGATSVLCVDKTGTLTVNRMRVAHLYANGRRCWRWTRCRARELAENFHAAGRVRHPGQPDRPRATRWSRRFTAWVSSSWRRPSICIAIGRWRKSTRLTPELRAMARSGSGGGRGLHVVAAKGSSGSDRRSVPSGCRAPEGDRRGSRCHGCARSACAGRGPRAFCRAALAGGASMISISSSSACSAWPTPCARKSRRPMRECHAAGIRVVMITGDYPVTARPSPAGPVCRPKSC